MVLETIMDEKNGGFRKISSRACPGRIGWRTQPAGCREMLYEIEKCQRPCEDNPWVDDDVKSQARTRRKRHSMALSYTLLAHPYGLVRKPATIDSTRHDLCRLNHSAPLSTEQHTEYTDQILKYSVSGFWGDRYFQRKKA